MAFVLPSKREAGVLMNPDLNKEWDGNNKVVTSDGAEITWTPPPPKPVMPDWSEIKAIRGYFNRSYKNNFWPAWLYNHKTGEQRIVADANEAAEFGVCMRPRTADEKARFGDGHTWDWKDDTHWRPTPPEKPRVYDPRRPEQGKEFVPTPVPQSTANRQMLDSALPAVTAAVVAALKESGSVNPSNIDPKQWDKFLAFQAWEKTQEAIDVVVPKPDEADIGVGEMEEIEAGGEAPPVYANKLEGGNERQAWVAEAERKGIKVDGRWSLDRLKSEVEKAN